MLRIEVVRARAGMRLALPVCNPRSPSHTLLKMGYELTDSVVERLKEYGVRSVWVRYPSLAYLERYVSQESVQLQNQVVGQIAHTFQSLQGKANAKLPYDQYTQALQEMVEHLASHPQSAVFLGDMAAYGDGMLRHSATVTYLTLLMGMKLEGYLVKERKHVNPARAKEVTNLGLGAMLHDVGVMQLPPDVRQRYDQEGDEGDAQWQDHPALGFQLVRGHVDPSAATVVLNHHQRYDGSGYAGMNFPVLEEKRIHVFARLAAVADQFDRLANPVNLPSQPTVWVLHALTSQPLCQQFDPEALRALLTVVPPYPPGSMVRLTDGRFAVCVDHHPEDPCRPTVQIIPEPTADLDDLPAGPSVDLSESPVQLAVAEHEGRDVRELNFATPPLMLGHGRQLAWT